MPNFSRCHLLKILAQPLAKKIDQRAIEQWSSHFWQLPQTKVAANEGDRKPFVMMFPPPNITGSLHLGHALTGAIQDALVRYRRMQGCKSIFIPGFDHAGLATQSIVEKLLWKRQGITRQQLGREKFIALVDEWKDSKRKEMRDQLNRLGLDLDFDKEYFTMDERSSRAVHAAFKKLFNDGVIYRSSKPIFWSEQLQTTLSDIEVDTVDGVHRYSRTGEIVAKRSLSQWFIDAKSLAEKAVNAVQNHDIEMIPAAYKKSWSSWLLENGVQDWCISRQSWWGHRIPAYNCTTLGDTGSDWIVADSLDEAKQVLGPEAMQDPDVLDTWFSSSLLPLTVSGWPDEEKFAHSCRTGLFPLHIMETGFDILTYWVSKMAMISLALTNRVPFKLVLLHGMICDSDGKKMSKSRGNVIDPLDVIDGSTLVELQNRLIEAHSQGILDSKQLASAQENQKRIFPQGIPPCGADGLRAYLLSHDFQEEVVRVQIQQIEKVRRLSNKLWNVFRFLSMIVDKSVNQNIWQLEHKPDITSINQSDLDEDDQQVLQLMSDCVFAAHQSFRASYQLHQTFNLLEQFISVHLSHSYLRKVKTVLWDEEIATLEARRLKLDILAICLMTSTKLLHPFMPHLTEFLYQKLVITTGNSELSDDKHLSSQLQYENFPSLDDWAPHRERESCQET